MVVVSCVSGMKREPVESEEYVKKLCMWYSLYRTTILFDNHIWFMKLTMQHTFGRSAKISFFSPLHFQGEKIFYLIPPTSENISKMLSWYCAGDKFLFLGDLIPECYEVHLTAGNSLFMPTGILENKVQSLVVLLIVILTVTFIYTLVPIRRTQYQ